MSILEKLPCSIIDIVATFISRDTLKVLVNDTYEKKSVFILLQSINNFFLHYGQIGLTSVVMYLNVDVSNRRFLKATISKFEWLF